MPRRRLAPREHRVLPRRPERLDAKLDGSWNVRAVAGSSAKSYRCPDCQQLITPATPHLVIWPIEKALLSDSAIDERRHWHTACWARRH